jgi:hypothetical protein
MADSCLTLDEARAIRSLERLAKRWPKSLMLFSHSGTLNVIKLDDEGGWSLPGGHHDGNAIVTTITGIQNDGGDPNVY